MTDATIKFVSRLNALSDECATCACASHVVLSEIAYDRQNKPKIDVLYGVVAILDQLSEELKSLAEQADYFTLNTEDMPNES